MDLKEPGNLLYIVGRTREELGGSHFHLVQSLSGGRVPEMMPFLAKETFAAMHRAIHGGLVRACHDLSEGGLAVATAETAFAGGFGATIDLLRVPCDDYLGAGTYLGVAEKLFSESNTRVLCEVRPEHAAAFEEAMRSDKTLDVPHARIGEVTENDRLLIRSGDETVVESDLASLKEAWQKPLRW